eukprot:GFYU01014629.1.p1 GENE.GFYU01014629.1~~GFYU01014629.1.p1  ORF type:complete len:197 (-),score=51.93 GFYU01014629.1:117-650(-)
MFSTVSRVANRASYGLWTAAIAAPARAMAPVSAVPAKLYSTEVQKPKRLNHIAIAVNDLKESAEFYKNVVGADVSEPQALPEHGVTVVFVDMNNTKVELLEPLGVDSPIAGYLKKNPSGGLHHICIEYDDIDKAVDHVKATGTRTLAENTKIGAHGKPVMFLHPKDCNGVLTELEQS